MSENNNRIQLPVDFDAAFYLLVNRDVADAGVDAIEHYLEYGHKEGRLYKPNSTLLYAKMEQDAYDNDGLRSVHNHDFMIDHAYLSAYRRGVQAAGSDYKWYWRVHIGLWAATTASKLSGDYVECGVNRGFLSSAIMQQLSWDSTGRIFYLLDTFQGIDLKYLNENEIEGGVSVRNSLDLKSGFYTNNLKEVEHNFAEWANIKIIQGSIPDTLIQISAEKVAFLHIDLNCAEPEVAALEYLWDKMVCGGIVLLDDYAYFGFQSQKVAMDNWALKHNVAIASLPTGQGLIVKT